MSVRAALQRVQAIHAEHTRPDDAAAAAGARAVARRYGVDINELLEAAELVAEEKAGHVLASAKRGLIKETIVGLWIAGYLAGAAHDAESDDAED